MKWYDQILARVKGIFNLSHDATESEVHAALEGFKTHEELKAQIKSELAAEQQTAIDAAVAAVQSDLDTAQENNTDLQKQVDDLKAENANLKQQLQAANVRISELEKEPAGEHTQGKTETESGKSKNLWDDNPVNQKAAQMRRGRS